MTIFSRFRITIDYFREGFQLNIIFATFHRASIRITCNFRTEIVILKRHSQASYFDSGLPLVDI